METSSTETKMLGLLNSIVGHGGEIPAYSNTIWECQHMSIYPSGYYIYAYLREDGTLYYVGKGKGNRAWSKHHFKHGIGVPSNPNRIVIMESNLSNVGACALERFYIRWYGRKDLNTGTLHNKTEGGESSDGYKHTDITKEKIREKRKHQIMIVTQQKCENISKSKSKYWCVFTPEGKQIKVLNLYKFCEDNGLSAGNMSQVANGKRKQHKGYSVKYNG